MANRVNDDQLDSLLGDTNQVDVSPLTDFINSTSTFETLTPHGLAEMLTGSNENQNRVGQEVRTNHQGAPFSATVQSDGNPVLLTDHNRRRSHDPNANSSFSPHQTESSASAGSPSSGSDNSPCPGPDHQSVIMPHHQILGVPQMPELGQYMNMQGVPRGFPPHFTHNTALYPHPQMTIGSLPQASPPTGSNHSLVGPYWQQATPEPDLNAIFQNGERPQKRMRNDQFKPDPSSPRISEDPDYMDFNNPQQSIHFSEFEKEKWHALLDERGYPLKSFGFHVVADKGFNFSQFDTAFVNQKKNHFQVSVHIENFEISPPKMLRVGNEMPKPLKMMKVQEGNQWVERAEFRLSFYGVKAEMTSSKVAIRQSQTDRKPVDYEPVKLACPESKVTKVTVARLHFSETTMNNQRKNGRPNPDQKYLNLAVNLQAVTIDDEIYTVMSFASDRVIVRASNPGQFDSGETSEGLWQKGSTAYGGSNYIYHPGSVCVGTEKPFVDQNSTFDPSKAALTVGGHIFHLGDTLKFSDRRFKTNIEERDTREALENVSRLKIVRYEIRPEYCEEWSLSHEDRCKTGVIAQEVQEVIPDAVRQHGQYLAVDDSRLFYESTAAVQELTKLTGELTEKVHADVENINKRLRRICKLKRIPSFKSTASSHESGVNCSTSYLSCSLSSLASGIRKTGDEPEVQFTANKRGKYRQCNNMCQMGRGDALVNNRIVQYACVALVAIIAFCLVAMTTLYVMDWNSNRELKKRTQMSTMHPDNSSLYPATGLEPGQIVDVNVPDEDGGWNPPNWPGGAPASLFPCASDSVCDFYCCPNSNINYKSDVAPQSQSRIDFQPLEDNSHVADRVKRRSLFDQGVNMGTKGRGIGPVDMHILDVNHTIGRDYCTSRACNDHKGGNYTIHVPISEHMPLMSLQLAFDVPEGSTVSFCGDGPREECDAPGKGSAPTKLPGSLVHTANQVFYLPVGFYVRSEYRFRIGSTTACTAELSDVGHTYEEYNVVFYRVCAP